MENYCLVRMLVGKIDLKGIHARSELQSMPLGPLGEKTRTLLISRVKAQGKH